MNDKLVKVADFHETFEHPIGNLETLEPLNIRQLRIKLLFEELTELAEAGDVKGTMYMLCQHFLNDNISFNPADGNNVNKVEELDALCDLEYVLMGKVLTAGLHHIFDKSFDIVNANNMTKAHKSLQHAADTILKKGGDPNGYKMIQKGDAWLLLNPDGKLTKPHDHIKVQLTLE